MPMLVRFCASGIRKRAGRRALGQKATAVRLAVSFPLKSTPVQLTEAGLTASSWVGRGRPLRRGVQIITLFNFGDGFPQAVLIVMAVGNPQSAKAAGLLTPFNKLPAPRCV